MTSLSGTLDLSARVGGALARIAFDRAEERFGRALPRLPEQLADPNEIDTLVSAFWSGDAPLLPPLRAAWLPGVTFESSNCTNFLIELDYEDDADVWEGAPRTLYAKLPCDDLGTRAFANAVGFWEVETAFCQRVASRVPIRVPRVYAAAKRGSRFVLLLENLHEIPGATLFNNRDMAAGTTVERARLCLRTLAELHAAFWGRSQAERDALIPPRLHTYLSSGGRERTRALNSVSVTPAHRAAPDVFTREHADTFKLAMRKWDALIEAWYAEPLTLAHGDSHLANFFEYPDAEGPRMGMIDFQGMHWCQGIRDVQYFLINSMDPKLLAENEESLIDFYLAELAARDVHLDPATAREQYKAFSFQTLMVAVTSIGLGALTERNETVLTILERSVAASERLAFAEWLGNL